MSVKKLVHLETITVPAAAEFGTREFFTTTGENEVTKITIDNRFQEMILARASERISRGAHKLNISWLSGDIHDSDIWRELSDLKPITVDEYLASIKVRIEMWARDEDGHYLRENGHPNVEYVSLDDRIVVVFCAVDLELSPDLGWFFFSYEISQEAYQTEGTWISLPEKT